MRGVRRRVAEAIGAHRREMSDARREMSRDPMVEPAERNLLARIDLRVHPADAMHAGDSRHYIAVGLSAVRCIGAACAAADAADPERILDLPCGHGRVLRALAARFPGAELTACDLDRGGVDFCAARFGARPVYSSEDLTELPLPPAAFDLIWCGSLATHLDAHGNELLLAALAAALTPDGVLVLSTHGDSVAERMRGDARPYQLDSAVATAVADAHRASGFGYADYAWSPGYGIAVASPGWMRGVAETAGLHTVWCGERCWDDHQDVFGFVRA